MKIYIGTMSGLVHTIEQTGRQLTKIDTVEAGEYPSWIVLNETKDTLYALDRVDTYDGAGALLVFDLKDGMMKKISTVPLPAPDPCHAALTSDGRLLLIANYAGASFTTVSTETLSVIENIDMNGDAKLGPHPVRQKEPHPHMIQSHGDFVYGCDLGQDRVFQWKIEGNKLKPLSSPALVCKAGCGPRHIDFHPHANLAFVINELESTLTSHAIDLNGHMRVVTSMSTLPQHCDGKDCTGGEVIVSPDGNDVYASNRGAFNTIVQFRVDRDGLLETKSCFDSHGDTPRHIQIDPTGNWMVVCNQKSDTVDLFSRNETGSLEWVSAIKLEKPTIALYA